MTTTREFLNFAGRLKMRLKALQRVKNGIFRRSICRDRLKRRFGYAQKYIHNETFDEIERHKDYHKDWRYKNRRDDVVVAKRPQQRGIKKAHHRDTAIVNILFHDERIA
jgi:hypothetical protein